MQIDDFWVVHNAHWARDQKPRHGRFRVEMSLMMLLSAATGTRPGAVVESASAKGTNKAILYDHVTIVRARDVADPNWITTLAFVRLVNLKNVRRKGNGLGSLRSKFTSSILRFIVGQSLSSVLKLFRHSALLAISLA